MTDAAINKFGKTTNIVSNVCFQKDNINNKYRMGRCMENLR